MGSPKDAREERVLRRTKTVGTLSKQTNKKFTTMFLDEELENILKENNNDSVKAVKSLMEACFHRLPDAKKVTAATFENSLRQIENSWKLFCSRHRQFRADGFKACVLFILKKDFPEDQINKFKAVMRW